MPKHANILLASNPAYWPSIGGSERVIQTMVEGVRNDFDRVAVFTFRDTDEVVEHNGVEIHPYSKGALRRFAAEHRPRVYFPNMVHSPITQQNIAYVSKRSGRTILNMIGGYAPGTRLGLRASILRKARLHSDIALHVDPLSAEHLIDKVIEPKLDYHFLSQGIDRTELDQAKKAAEAKESESYYLFAHNLWYYKSPERFVSEVVAKLPHLNFKINASDKVGDRIEAIREQAKSHKNLSVELGLPREDFIRTIAGAEGLVSTSLIEGAQPNIMLEAGYLGVPYFSLCPGQNYGHYPHVEMFASSEKLVSRLSELGNDARKAKSGELERSMRHFSQQEFSWDWITEQFRELCVKDL